MGIFLWGLDGDSESDGGFCRFSDLFREFLILFRPFLK